MIGEQLFSLVDELGRRKILLNFGNVEFLSSAALGKLITLNKQAPERRRQAGPVQHRPADLRGLRDHQAQQAVQHPEGRAGRPCRRSDARVASPAVPVAWQACRNSHVRMTRDHDLPRHHDPLKSILASDLAEARRVQDEIEAALQPRRFAERDIFGIKLALEEALVNAIKHGNQMDRGQEGPRRLPRRRRPLRDPHRRRGPRLRPRRRPRPDRPGEPRTPLRPRPAAHAPLHDRGRLTTTAATRVAMAKVRGNGRQCVVALQ